MKKIKLIMLSLALIGFSAFAKDDKQVVLDLFYDVAKKLSCDGFDDWRKPDKLVGEQLFTKIFDNGNGLYTIHWVGIGGVRGVGGCDSEIRGRSFNILTLVKKSGNSLKVLQKDVFDELDIARAFLTSIVQNSPKTFDITGEDLGVPGSSPNGSPDGNIGKFGRKNAELCETYWGLQLKNNKWVLAGKSVMTILD